VLQASQGLDDSEATVLSEISRKLWAIDDNIGNFLAFIFHQANISKFSLSSLLPTIYPILIFGFVYTSCVTCVE
jgi:hypothetical protein